MADQVQTDNKLFFRIWDALPGHTSLECVETLLSALCSILGASVKDVNRIDEMLDTLMPQLKQAIRETRERLDAQGAGVLQARAVYIELNKDLEAKALEGAMGQSAEARELSTRLFAEMGKKQGIGAADAIGALAQVTAAMCISSTGNLNAARLAALFTGRLVHELVDAYGSEPDKKSMQ